MKVVLLVTFTYAFAREWRAWERAGWGGQGAEAWLELCLCLRAHGMWHAHWPLHGASVRDRSRLAGHCVQHNSTNIH